MKKSVFILVVIAILYINNACAYDKIINFDENEDIIYTTVVYRSNGDECTNCNCTLKLYNPHPNENFLNLSTNLTNVGNGVYSVNLSNITNLVANKNIYPTVTTCVGYNGEGGSDNRDGIKVNQTLFNYLAGTLPLTLISIALLFAGIIMRDNENRNIRRLIFFSSFVFLIGSLLSSFFIFKLASGAGALVSTSEIMVIALIMISMGVFALWFFRDHLERPVEEMGKGKSRNN